MRFKAGLLLAFLPAVAWAVLQRPPAAAPAPTEAVAVLQQQINSGKVKLDFEEDRGYIRSVLNAFKIPVSSQGLVFGRNSFQLDLISPASPRAIYFNDNVYIGFVQGGQLIEVASIDPKLGPVFYALTQQKRTRPVFQRETSNCLVCHDSGGNGIPRLLVLSTINDSSGTAIGKVVYSTTDESPLKERFGGWYVTGTHGDQKHMGNVFSPLRLGAISNVPEYIKRMDLGAGANVTDLKSRLDTKPYLSPHSDIVALMVLAHQTQVHNFISRAAYKVKEAIDTKVPAEKLEDVVENYSEPIVEAMLFSGAAPLTAPVAGTSGFAAEFTAGGPRDSRGRSLRELDLKTRLLRYPMSYLIYTDSFDQMPPPVKEYVYRRFREVLTGQDKTKAYEHLSTSDRQAILEILKDTKPDFAK